jgi:hypothetical protein
MTCAAFAACVANEAYAWMAGMTLALEACSWMACILLFAHFCFILFAFKL